MQRLPSGFVAVLSITTLLAVAACNGKSGETKADASSAGEPAADGSNEDEAAADGAAAEGAAVEGAAAEGADEPTTAIAPTTEEPPVAEDGAETGGAEAGGETGGEDPVPALLEQAKNLETDDEAATKALDDALAAGGAKLDIAKAANARGEALMTKGESERAEGFFVWARDTHKVFADPVYNLATLAAYAGDLEVAKEHLQELEKRGNKKLMKKVGVDQAFAPLHDDPDVRKIYEQ